MFHLVGLDPALPLANNQSLEAASVLVLRVEIFQIVGAGNLKSIGQVGLGFSETGKLELSTSKLEKAIENGSQDVEEFFSTSDSGLAARLDSLAEKLAGGTNLK